MNTTQESASVQTHVEQFLQQAALSPELAGHLSPQDLPQLLQLGFARMLEAALDKERQWYLADHPADRANGYAPRRTLHVGTTPVPLDRPRTRQGFYPAVLPKHQRLLPEAYQQLLQQIFLGAKSFAAARRSLQALGLGYSPEQVQEAAKWFRRAAEQHHAPAQNELGTCYQEGRGVETNYAEAVKWFRQAAEQNEPSAQMNLGICYGLGQGVRKDAIEAYKWWLLAGAQGHASARQNLLAMEHQLTREQLVEGQKRAGDFKPQAAPLQDVKPADFGQIPSELLVKAEAGDAKAQNELGAVFYAGKQGAARNPVEAVKWFHRAAEQNLAAAQSNLGLCYERGDGVAKYVVEAYKWDLLAATQGDTKAKRNVTLLELLLSPEEIAAGKQRAQDWLEQHKNPPTNQ